MRSLILIILGLLLFVAVNCAEMTNNVASRQLLNSQNNVARVRRVREYLKKAKYASSICAGAPDYSAAVLDYISDELSAKAGGKRRRKKYPRHIRLAITNDPEVKKVLNNAEKDPQVKKMMVMM